MNQETEIKLVIDSSCPEFAHRKWWEVILGVKPKRVFFKHEGKIYCARSTFDYYLSLLKNE